MLRRALVIVVGGWIVAACGAFGSGPDAAPAATDAGGAPDAAAPEASALGDAGVDATRAACGGSVLCDDFETDAGSLGWKPLLSGTGSTVGVVAGAGPDASRALVGTTTGTTYCASAEWTLDLPASASGFDLTLRMRRDAGEGDGLLYAGLGDSCGLLLKPATTAADSIALRQDHVSGPATGDTRSLGSMPTGAWAHVHVRFDTAGRSYLVEVDGAKRVEGSLPPTCTSAPPTLSIGPHCSVSSQGTSAAYDDVRFEILP